MYRAAFARCRKMAGVSSSIPSGGSAGKSLNGSIGLFLIDDFYSIFQHYVLEVLRVSTYPTLNVENNHKFRHIIGNMLKYSSNFNMNSRMPLRLTLFKSRYSVIKFVEQVKKSTLYLGLVIVSLKLQCSV